MVLLRGAQVLCLCKFSMIRSLKQGGASAVRLGLPYHGSLLDVTCEFLSCRSRRPGLPLSGKARTRDPLACAAKQSVSGPDV